MKIEKSSVLMNQWDYRFSAISIKIPTQFFTEKIKNKPETSYGNNKISRVVQIILNNKINVGSITIADLKSCYRALLIKTEVDIKTYMPINGTELEIQR